MWPIDLVKFSEHTARIPEDMLVMKKAAPPSFAKFLAAHVLDLYAVVAVTFSLAVISTVVAGSFMLTPRFEEMYSTGKAGFGFMIFPVVLYSYFFFSYFFNDGQTWGMRTMKLRLSMPTQSFGEPLLMALWSSLCFLNKTHSVSMEHDHLYAKLMYAESTVSLDLHSLLEAKKSEETFQNKAA